MVRFQICNMFERGTKMLSMRPNAVSNIYICGFKMAEVVCCDTLALHLFLVCMTTSAVYTLIFI